MQQWFHFPFSGSAFGCDQLEKFLARRSRSTRTVHARRNVKKAATRKKQRVSVMALFAAKVF
jgi:hypothetical protein